jgi:hypothetical protein
MARPCLELDMELIERAASIMCTMEEIAVLAGCSVDTLERRAREPIDRGREKGRASLRRWMWDNAKKGNTSIQIWLSKQHLGMRDKSPEEIEAFKALANAGQPISKEERLELVRNVRAQK